MSDSRKTNTAGKQVAVVIGATSKWQSDGRNTLLAHGKTVDDSDLPVGVRWGVGGAIAQKFAQEGFFVVLTTRKQANASALAEAIRQQGGDCTIVELDLASQGSISAAFATIRRDAGDPAPARHAALNPLRVISPQPCARLRRSSSSANNIYQELAGVLPEACSSCMRASTGTLARSHPAILRRWDSRAKDSSALSIAFFTRRRRSPASTPTSISTSPVERSGFPMPAKARRYC